MRKQIEQERHRGVEAAEERQRARGRQPRILGDRDGGIGEPAGEQDEADRQQLAGVREVERRRHDDVGQRGRSALEAGLWRPSSVLLASVSAGSTMNSRRRPTP